MALVSGRHELAVDLVDFGGGVAQERQAETLATNRRSPLGVEAVHNIHGVPGNAEPSDYGLDVPFGVGLGRDIEPEATVEGE